MHVYVCNFFPQQQQKALSTAAFHCRQLQTTFIVPTYVNNLCGSMLESCKLQCHIHCPKGPHLTLYLFVCASLQRKSVLPSQSVSDFMSSFTHTHHYYTYNHIHLYLEKFAWLRRLQPLTHSFTCHPPQVIMSVSVICMRFDFISAHFDVS